MARTYRRQPGQFSRKKRTHLFSLKQKYREVLKVDEWYSDNPFLKRVRRAAMYK